MNDERFVEAAALIVVGDLDGLDEMLADEPELARHRASEGHPTLLQLVACEEAGLPDPLGAAQRLVAAGAELQDPLVAAAGCGSMGVLDLLLDAGADVDRPTSWTPLDEALYWAQESIARRLVERGSGVRALSTAAGLGGVDGLERFFVDGRPGPDAGPIASPWPDLVPPAVADDPQAVLDHAFVMAVNNRRRAAAEELLARGAAVNAAPPGYHWRGTALHAAIWRGDEAMVAWLLERGADPTIRDGDNDADALGWARHFERRAIIELLGG